MADGTERLPPQGRRRDSAAETSAERHASLERRAAAQPGADYGALLSARPAGPQPVQRAAPPNRTGLPDRLKSGVEALSGVSLDRVRVHFGSPRPAALGALAFARGTDIHLAPGEERHLPHEAWHVVQQAQGRVRPTMQLKDGVAVNADAGLEHEADMMGARALHTPASTAPLERGASATPVAQLYWLEDDDGEVDWIDGICGPPLIETDLIHPSRDGHPAGRVWVLPEQVPMEAPEEAVVDYSQWKDKGSNLKKSKEGSKFGKSKSSSSEKEKEKAYVPTTVSEIDKEEQIKDYLDLIGHLAGEGGGKEELTGGHLLSEMMTKYPNLVLSGKPDGKAPWQGWWSDGKAPPKWSSFFPASWTKNDLVIGLYKSSSVRGGRELPGGIRISKTGGTFYPWVNQTLGKPALKDMKPAKELL